MPSFIEKSLSYLKTHWKKLLPLLLVPVFFMVFQLGNYGKFADPDGFYHAKASQFLVQGKLTSKFPWNYHTTWREGYADQHFLYHLLLAPFNTFPAMQWSIVVFSSLFVFAFIFVMKRFKVRWKAFWTMLLLAGSADFLFRINLIKANTLSLILMFLAVLVIRNLGRTEDRNTKARYYIMLAVLSAIFTWTYGGFVVVPLIILAYIVANLMVERKIVIAPLLVSFAGIMIGILLHPQSTNFLTLIYDQLFQTGLGAGSKVPAGQEWLTAEIGWFFKSNSVLLVAWLLTIILALRKLIVERSINKELLWLNGVTAGMVILHLWHRRFVEYSMPFMVLTSAYGLSPYAPLVESWIQENVIVKFTKKGWVIVMVALFISSSLIFSITTLQQKLSESDSYLTFRNVAMAIAKDSPGRSIVINTRWDHMPQLLYWNDKDYYAVGLDPTFMYLENEEIYWLWRKVADNELQNFQNRTEIRDLFKSRLRGDYIVVEQDKNPHIFTHLNANPDFYEVLYKDKTTAAYKIK